MYVRVLYATHEHIVCTETSPRWLNASNLTPLSIRDCHQRSLAHISDDEDDVDDDDVVSGGHAGMVEVSETVRGKKSITFCNKTILDTP